MWGQGSNQPGSLQFPGKLLCCNLDARPNCLGWSSPWLCLPQGPAAINWLLTFPFTVFCKLLRERQELASQGSFTPGLGPFQRCRQVMCLQISTVGQSDLEAISFFSSSNSYSLGNSEPAIRNLAGVVTPYCHSFYFIKHPPLSKMPWSMYIFLRWRGMKIGKLPANLLALKQKRYTRGAWKSELGISTLRREDIWPHGEVGAVFLCPLPSSSHSTPFPCGHSLPWHQCPWAAQHLTQDRPLPTPHPLLWTCPFQRSY